MINAQFTLTPVIIINWNGLSDTIECIDSILDSQWTGYHLHIIDNNSDHNEGDQIKRRYLSNSNITTHLYHDNLGFTGAHNKIWKEYLSLKLDITHIALINNDIYIPQDSSFIKNTIRDRIDLSCPIMMQYHKPTLIDNCGLQLMSTGEILPAGHGTLVSAISIDHKNKIIGPSGGACLISTKLIDEIGFFDDFFETGYEDAEFALRATMAGHTTLLDSDNIIYHKGGQSIKKIYSHQSFIRTQRNILYTIFKLFPPIALTMIILLLPFYYLGLIMISIILFRWTYTTSFFNALYCFIVRDYSKAMTQRAKFKAYRKLSSSDLIRIQQSSIKLAVVRLWRIFVMRNHSKLDEY